MELTSMSANMLFTDWYTQHNERHRKYALQNRH